MTRPDHRHITIWSAIFVLAALLTLSNAQYNVDRQVANTRIAQLEAQVATLSDREAELERRVEAAEARQAQAQAQERTQSNTTNKPSHTSIGDYVRMFFSDGIPIGGVTP